jgi:hypothetical protein
LYVITTLSVTSGSTIGPRRIIPSKGIYIILISDYRAPTRIGGQFPVKTSKENVTDAVSFLSLAII